MNGHETRWRHQPSSTSALVARCLLAAATVLSIVVGIDGGRPVQAFPQWQFSTSSARCDQCHFSPTGGGILTGYGQDAAGEDLSSFGGNGAFLHGAGPLPKWMAVGGDFRGALVAQDVQDPAGGKVAVFPMQAQVAARVSVGDVSAYGSVAYRGQIRPNESVVPEQNYQPVRASWLISPEHYLMWRPSPLGVYVRAGRFFAPFGMRFAEHNLYVRSDLGFDWMQETYNLSGGYVADEYEVHLTAFAPDFVRHLGSRESGVAAYLERRFADQAGSVALQGRYASTPEMTRSIVGALGKYWLAPTKVMFLLEGDLVHRELGSAGGSEGFVGMAGLSLLPTKGIMVTVFGERSQTEISVRDSATNAVMGLFSWFPYAHTEIQLMGLLQAPAGMPTAKTFLAQLHYFL